MVEGYCNAHSTYSKGKAAPHQTPMQQNEKSPKLFSSTETFKAQVQIQKKIQLQNLNIIMKVIRAIVLQSPHILRDINFNNSNTMEIKKNN